MKLSLGVIVSIALLLALGGLASACPAGCPDSNPADKTVTENEDVTFTAAQVGAQTYAWVIYGGVYGSSGTSLGSTKIVHWRVPVLAPGATSATYWVRLTVTSSDGCVAEKCIKIQADALTCQEIRVKYCQGKDPNPLPSYTFPDDTGANMGVTWWKVVGDCNTNSAVWTQITDWKAIPAGTYNLGYKITYTGGISTILVLQCCTTNGLIVDPLPDPNFA